MPIEWLVDYWDKMAEKALPFLQGHRIAIEQKFDHQIIYRRHKKVNPGKESAGWIYVKEKEDVLEWAKQHTFSFHTHLEGEDDTYFALDIDNHDGNFPLGLIKVATIEMSKILDEHKIDYLLKFSGGNSFHFLSAFKNSEIKGKRIFEIEQRAIVHFQKELERRLQKSSHKDEFYKHLAKDDPITITNSRDKEHKKSILIDEFILKRHSVIRSPFSVHPKTLLVSVPMEKSKIENFDPKKDASREVVLKSTKVFQKPFNKLAVFEKLIS